MKNKCRLFVICVLLVAATLLKPVTYVLANDGVYSEEVPYLEGIEFNMHVNAESNRGVLLDTVMKDKDISAFIFKFDKLDGINYENYEVVFDMDLKSKLTDGTITTHKYSKSFDVTACKPGFIDNFLMSVGLKDSFYEISMDFDTLIKNSPDCIAEEKFVADNLNFSVKKVYVYNTVITKVDCYLREKSTGNYGLISRFLLTWDKEFRNALCTNVTYNLITPETNEILESGSISNASGSYGYDSDGSNGVYNTKSLLTKLVDFLTEIPFAIYAFVSGFFGLYSSIGKFFKVTFPFLPAIIFDILGVVIFFTIAFSIWLFLKE